MIRGYWQPSQGGLRPTVDISFIFPTLGGRRLGVRLLIDTGADRTVLSPRDALRLGIDLATVAPGPSMRGVGGRTNTGRVPAALEMGAAHLPLDLTILLPAAPLSVPSLLGRDVLSHFALFMEERTQRVLLLEPDEVDRLAL